MGGAEKLALVKDTIHVMEITGSDEIKHQKGNTTEY
jgi:hypothetical protein